MTTLPELLTLVRAADGPSREIDVALVKMAYAVNAYPTAFPERDWEFYTDDLPITVVPRYSGSIDAALALVERLLPDANTYGISKTPKEWEAFVSRNYVTSGHWLHEEQAPTGPLALLAALLSASPAAPDKGRE